MLASSTSVLAHTSDGAIGVEVVFEGTTEDWGGKTSSCVDDTSLFSRGSDWMGTYGIRKL